MKVIPHNGLGSEVPPGSEALKWRQFGETIVDRDPVQDLGDHQVIEFFDELKPLLYIMKGFGLFPLQKKYADGCTYTRCYWSLVHSVLVYLGMSVYAVYVSLQRFSSIRSSETEFDELMFSVVHFLYVLPHFYLIPCHWIEVGKVGAYFSLWSDFQKQFLMVTGRPFRLGQRKRALWSALLVPVFVAVYFLAEVYLVSPAYQTWELSFYIYIFILLVLHVTWWWLVCSSLRGAMAAYSVNFFKDRNMMEYDRHALTVAQYRLLWISLARLARETGMFMCFTYGHLCVITFVIMTLQLYGSLSNIQNGMYLRHLGLGLCVSMAACIVFMAANSAYHASSEISGEFVERLSSLCSSDKQVRRELKMFIQVTSVNSADINLGGYVNFNRGFLLNYMSTMATYLIVLLQFRLGILSINNPANASASSVFK